MVIGNKLKKEYVLRYGSHNKSFNVVYAKIYTVRSTDVLYILAYATLMMMVVTVVVINVYKDQINVISCVLSSINFKSTIIYGSNNNEF